MDTTYAFFGFLTMDFDGNDQLTVSSNSYTLVSAFSAIGIRGFSCVFLLTQACLELLEFHFALRNPSHRSLDVYIFFLLISHIAICSLK